MFIAKNLQYVFEEREIQEEENKRQTIPPSSLFLVAREVAPEG